MKKFLINSKEKLFKIKRLVVEKIIFRSRNKTKIFQKICKYPFNFKANSLEKIQDIKFDDYKEEMCLDIKVQIKNFIIKNK